MSENSEDGWVEHDGNGMPIDGSSVVQIRQRDGWVSGGGGKNASFWKIANDCWSHSSGNGRGRNLSSYDIVAYRVVKP